jgi:hypothetical protein
MRTILCSSLLGILIVIAGVAQQKPSPKTTGKPGVVSGRVFAITKSGDLKPARMAHVYLLYWHRTTKSDPKEEDSARWIWQANLNIALENFNKKLETNLAATKRGEEGLSEPGGAGTGLSLTGS